MNACGLSTTYNNADVIYVEYMDNNNIWKLLTTLICDEPGKLLATLERFLCTDARVVGKLGKWEEPTTGTSYDACINAAPRFRHTSYEYKVCMCCPSWCAPMVCMSRVGVSCGLK